MIEHYFSFIKNITGKAKTRFDLFKYSEPIYEPLYLPFIYFQNTPDNIKCKQKRKSDFGISQKRWLSSVYIPDILNSQVAFGDIKGTQDLLLIVLNNEVIEIFIFRGKKHLYQSVLNLYNDSELFNEIDEIRARAIEYNKQVLELVKP